MHVVIPRPMLSAWLVAVVLIPLLSMDAQAQQASVSFAVSEGAGTVYTRPTHVVFRLFESVQGETMEKALEASAQFGEALREFVVENELRPTTQEISTPAIQAIGDNIVSSSAELRFSMAPFAGGAAGAMKFGALCDQIKVFADARKCALTEPEFVTTEAATIVRDAVQEACKNAHTAASAAAAALGATISEVDTVEVLTTTWNDPPESVETFPTVEQISCTAKARLTYLLVYP